MTKRSGLTLMELIVVVAIIAILASIAYPNYLHLKQQNRRTDAQAAVIATEALVERYLSENNEPNLVSSDMTSTVLTNYNPGSSTPVLSNGGYYLVTIVPDSQSYSINATAIANGTTNACTTVSIPEAYDQCADIDCWVISMTDGQKTSTNSSGVVANEASTTCW